MTSIPWLIITILTLLIIVGIVALVNAKKGQRRPPDYHAFFWMGLVWTIFGISLYREGNFTFLIIGLIFLITGLANKDKWKTNRVNWKDLTKSEQNFKIWVITGLGILLLLGFVALYLARMGMF